MGRLALHFLGDEAALDASGNPLTLPPATWPLLGCLLIAPHRRMARGALAGALWPDQDERSARHCLATALWRIKRRLGDAEELIALGSDSVGLVVSERVWIDVVSFEQVTQAALDDPSRLSDRSQREALRCALGYYRGDLLPMVSNEQIGIERERLRALYLDAGLEYVRACRCHREWRQACEIGRAICAAEPFREDAQRLLMEALIECGNAAQALQHYRDFAAVLDAELGVAPMAETRALADSIIRTPAVAAVPAGGVGEAPPRRMLLMARQQMLASLSLLDKALAQSRL
jgi:DNA-binding SARP family transcriptional activator